MDITELLSQYSAANAAEKLALISDRLLVIPEPERETFLHRVLLDDDLPAKRHAVKVLLTDTGIAVACARYLLVAVDPRDPLQTLRYYGARIIEDAGVAFDPRRTVPLLLAAYDRNDYRDTTHQILKALKSMFMTPIDAIVEGLSALPDEARGEIVVGLKRATTLDLGPLYRVSQLTRRKRVSTN